MNRKLQYIYNLFIAMIVSALAVSCTDDELVKGGDKYEVVPDIPVALSLKIKVADQWKFKPVWHSLTKQNAQLINCL